MLTGFQTAALGEWLRAADAKGWGVPPEHLPALADYARGRAEYRPLVVKAAGRRASWLADLNPEWRFLHAAVVEGNDHWTHGNPTQRRSWLRSHRQSDPVAALEALKEVWPTEPAATRLDFLGLLADNLAATDEEFLEHALDDRSKEVRRAAAGLLARIPGSQYGERMAQRVWSHLTVSQGGASDRLGTGGGPGRIGRLGSCLAAGECQDRRQSRRAAADPAARGVGAGHRVAARTRRHR
jgi:hypothetical protein